MKNEMYRKSDKMKFLVEIDVNNSAFHETGTYEVVRILEQIVEKMNNGQTYGACMDLNGNKVGNYSFTDDDYTPTQE